MIAIMARRPFVSSAANQQNDVPRGGQHDHAPVLLLCLPPPGGVLRATACREPSKAPGPHRILHTRLPRDPAIAAGIQCRAPRRPTRSLSSPPSSSSSALSSSSRFPRPFPPPPPPLPPPSSTPRAPQAITKPSREIAERQGDLRSGPRGGQEPQRGNQHSKRQPTPGRLRRPPRKSAI